MELNVLSINENTIQFDEEGVRFFLLIGKKSALLIDSGMHTKNAKDIAQKYTDLPIECINTHGDMDHIGSNSQFEWVYMHPSECVNYKGKIHPVWDQDILDLGNRKIQVIHIPGHTPGSIALLDIDSRILFSGDPIQKNGDIFMFGPMRNLQANICSLEKLEQMDSFDCLYPSHGICPIEREVISQIKKGCQDILNHNVKAESKEMFGHSIHSCDVLVSRILVD